MLTLGGELVCLRLCPRRACPVGNRGGMLMNELSLRRINGITNQKENMNREMLKTKGQYIAPTAEVWLVPEPLSLLETLSVDLYLEGDINGYEEIDDY